MRRFFLFFRKKVVEDEMKLTAKQRKFIDNYVECGNASKAAIDAGYAKKAAYQTGAENLRKPQIKAAIDERMKEIESTKIAQADEVLQFYTATLRGEITETVAVGTPDGVETVEVPPNVKTRLQAGRELMKRYPNTDPITEQQLRKLKAETKLLESKANTNEGTRTEITIYDSWGRNDGD